MKIVGYHFKPPKHPLHKKYKAMKITGYLTQCCNRILNEDEIYGIIGVQNMFRVFDSLKTVPPDNSQIHFCNECYQNQVIKQADLLVYKKNNVDGWTKKVEELAYLFKKSCMENKGKRIITPDLPNIDPNLPENEKNMPSVRKKPVSKLGKSNIK